MRVLVVFILLNLMCFRVGASQSQERKAVDAFLGYSINLTNYSDSVIITNICFMSHYNVQHGKDSINSLLGKRSIILDSQINDTIANIIQSMLLYYDSLNNKDIKMYINSPGGSVTAGLGIYDTMQFISSDVQTICTGMAASMSLVLLSAGTKGKRCSVKEGKLYIHNPQGGIDASNKNMEDIEKEKIEIEKFRKELLEILVNHTGQRMEKVDSDMKTTRWLGAKESQEYGIIDYIIE